MYLDDQPRIRAYALESPAHLFRVGLFVISTMNRQFESVPLLMRDYTEHGSSSRMYSGHQARALGSLASESQWLYSRIPAWERGKRGLTTAIRELCQQPGYGIVKAAFFAQLILPASPYGGCLDRHNLDKAGLDRGTFTRIPASIEKLNIKIETYIQVCKSLGGSAVIWDSWCAGLALQRPRAWPSAAAVSVAHVEMICKEER